MVHATSAQVAPVRALSSLTRHDVDAVRATVRAAGGGYTIEEHDDYDGYRSLLITPEAEAAPCYSVAGQTHAVELAAIDGDDLTVMGAFASVGAAMVALKPVLETRSAPVASVRQATSRALELLEGHGGEAAVQAALVADREAFWSPVVRAVDVLHRLPSHS